MQILLSDKNLKYDGSQLRSHFAYRNFGILGDSAVAFVGPCDVALDSMVDLEDVRNHAPIFSPAMLHFILESFQLDLKGGVLLQRLLVATVAERLRERGVTGLERRGDDLFDADKKLSVSIATRSPVSTLIHLGLNVRTEGAPVAAQGLAAWDLDPMAFAKACLESFQKEYDSVLFATYKVRGVP